MSWAVVKWGAWESTYGLVQGFTLSCSQQFTVCWNYREHHVPLWLNEWLYCLSYFYFTPAWNFIWHAKCSVGLLVGQNILPWLCKTVTLSSFICSVCLGWLRRWSLEVIYGLRVGHTVCGSRFSIHKEFQVLVNTQYFPNPIGSLWIWSNRLNSLSICLW